MIDVSKNNKTRVGYIIIGFCICMFITMAFFGLTLKGSPYNPETLCCDEINAHTIVVLDKTDALTDSQHRFLLGYINKEKDRLRTFEKFSVFTLTENTFANPEPVFSKCNPGRGKSANKLYQNPGKIQKRFDDYFSGPLKENLGAMLSNSVASKTPLFEMLRELSYRDDFGDRVQHRTLIFISDMMPHTSRYSHYKTRASYNKFVNTDYADEVSISLRGVNVKIIYLLRDKLRKYQGKSHLLFWQHYVESTGARWASVKSVW